MKKEIQLIHLEGMSVGVNDEKPVNGDYAYCLSYNRIYLIENNKIHSDDEKILFSIDKSLGELPVLVMPDEVDSYIKKQTDDFKMYLNDIINKIPQDIHNELWNYLTKVISASYHANPNKWTDEDMNTLSEKLWEWFNQEKGVLLSFDKAKAVIISSLRHKPRAVRVEMEAYFPEGRESVHMPYLRVATNPQNQIIITKADLIY